MTALDHRSERVVSILPCRDPEATLAFWRALGFEVLHDQRRPYLYLSVRRGGWQVDYTGGDSGPGRALVMVEDADALNAAFRTGVKAAYGRRLRSGTPRLGTVSQQARDRRFNMAGPEVNHFIVLTPGAKDEDLPRTALARDVKAARLAVDGEGDLAWAAALLDGALARASDEPASVRLAALVLRAGIAAATDARTALTARAAEARALAVEVPDATRDLQRLADLEAHLAHGTT
jgi:catechol 2,3-dioxygenase-like lactoylglutathione lyase family enzyme